jgi:four helix bundle protein
MNAAELKKRTKRFALDIISLSTSVPKTTAGQVMARQFVRSGTSIGANYRSACRARSKPDFISKLSIAVEEADETGYWLELLIESGVLKNAEMQRLLKEADELTAILNASTMTARINQKSAVKNQK